MDVRGLDVLSTEGAAASHVQIDPALPSEGLAEQDRSDCGFNISIEGSGTIEIIVGMWSDEHNPSWREWQRTITFGIEDNPQDVAARLLLDLAGLSRRQPVAKILNQHLFETPVSPDLRPDPSGMAHEPR